MKTAVVFLLFSLHCHGALVQLTDDTFVDFIKAPGRFCVMFYSPSCGACQDALPIFKRIAQRLNFVRIGQVDVTEHTASGDRYDIWNYPTVVIDEEGKFPFQLVYEGSPSNEAGLEKWIRKYGNPSYTPEPSNLWVLDERSFKRCIQLRVCVIQFTDSRCIQCNARRNQIHEAANNVDIPGYKAGVRIAQLDLKKFPHIGDQYGIELRGFVVHKIFSYGRMFGYYATDDWKGMVDYAEGRITSALVEITTMARFMDDVFHCERNSAVVLLLPQGAEARESISQEYSKWVESTRDILKHFIVTDAKLLSEMKVDSPKITIKHYFETLTPHEPPHIDIPVPPTANEQWFAEQFTQNQFSLLNHLDGWRRIKQIDDLPRYVGIFIEDPTWGFDAINKLKTEVGPLAAHFRDRIPFFIGDVAEVSVHFEEADTINADVPYHFMIRDNQDRKFMPDLPTLKKLEENRGNYTEFVSRYIEEYLAGRIPPRIKSDEDPGEHDGIIDVTGVSVDRVFRQTDKDVLLLLTTSARCRSCERFEEVFYEFGEYYENAGTLTVGIVNTATNELPRKLVMQADPPSIVLAPADRRRPYDNVQYFFDEISVDNLQKFVKEKGKHQLVRKRSGVIGEEEEDQEIKFEEKIKTEL